MNSEPIIYNSMKPHFRFTFIVTDDVSFIPGFIRTPRQKKKSSRIAIAIEHMNTCFVVTDKGTVPFPKYLNEIEKRLDSALMFQIEIKEPQKSLASFFFALTSQIKPSQQTIQAATGAIIRHAKGKLVDGTIEDKLWEQTTLLEPKSMLTWIIMAKDPDRLSEG